ncbi:anti-sigma factor [Aurantimonas aggregata]|uniref:Anti-sigma factor n=1 Tax=Aurantimonas aggregata TaxID=2047720 RepID=A0A6L9MEX6_9HYPH|nr:anti-sigma factor [Aurantimonas aggregata]NDV86307.1 anti-sigma factor [Aurantimonas aggregata]
MSDAVDHGREDAHLAAEYVLGVLSGGQRRSVERRALRDPAFAAVLAEWTELLGPMSSAVEPATPPEGIWSRIEADLGRMTRSQATQPADRPKGRRVSAIWQWLGLAGMGLAVASLAALILVAGRDLAPPADGMMTATLSTEDGTPLVTVVIDTATSMATLIPVVHAEEPGRVPELWLVPPGGAAPISLGLIDMARPLHVALEGSGLGMPDAALAVSMEPEGGSPTGLPTGPVVASGALHSI